MPDDGGLIFLDKNTSGNATVNNNPTPAAAISLNFLRRAVIEAARR
jgi:hypothetical protein